MGGGRGQAPYPVPGVRPVLAPWLAGQPDRRASTRALHVCNSRGDACGVAVVRPAANLCASPPKRRKKEEEKRKDPKRRRKVGGVSGAHVPVLLRGKPSCWTRRSRKVSARPVASEDSARGARAGGWSGRETRRRLTTARTRFAAAPHRRRGAAEAVARLRADPAAGARPGLMATWPRAMPAVDRRRADPAAGARPGLMATWPRAMPVVDRRPSAGGAVAVSSGNQNVAPGGARARRLAAAAAAARRARGPRCSQGVGRGTSYLLALAVAAPRRVEAAAATPGLAGLAAAPGEAGETGPCHALGPPSVDWPGSGRGISGRKSIMMGVWVGGMVSSVVSSVIVGTSGID